jgi:hypothetical protein
MDSVQAQSTAGEAQIREAIVAALAPYQPKVTANQPGSLVLEVGSVGMAYLIGGFRNKMKMPVRILVSLNGGPTGTGLSVGVESRGTGGGVAGGALGVSKQKKANQEWLQLVVNAVPGRIS